MGCACRNEDPSLPTLGKHQIAPSLGMVSDGNGGTFADFPVGMEFQARGGVGTSGRGGALGGHGYISPGPSAGRRTVRDPGGGRLRLTSEFGLDAAKLEAQLAGLTRLAENLARIASQFAKMGMRIEEIEIMPGGVVFVRSSSPIVVRPSNLVVPGTENDVPTLLRKQEVERRTKSLQEALDKDSATGISEDIRQAARILASMDGMIRQLEDLRKKYLEQEREKAKGFCGPKAAPQPQSAGAGKLPPSWWLRMMYRWLVIDTIDAKNVATRKGDWALAEALEQMFKTRNDRYVEIRKAVNSDTCLLDGVVKVWGTVERRGDKIYITRYHRLSDGTDSLIEEAQEYSAKDLPLSNHIREGKAHTFSWGADGE